VLIRTRIPFRDLLLTAACPLLWACVSYGQPAAAAPNLPVLTSIEQVRRLTPDEARRGYPVHLKAVVTYFDPADPELFLQDATGGIWVGWTPNMPKTAPGELIE
jgi:hypothetical protein